MLLASVMMSSFQACSNEDDAISGLTGVFEAPVDIDITGATLVDKEKNGALRKFTVDFITAGSEKVHLVLVANQYYIPSNGYTYASSETAKNGNFTDGSTIDGKAIKEGTFAISVDGDDITINKCSLFAEDGVAFRLQGIATLSLDPDDPTALVELKSATANPDGTVTVVASTGGYKENFNATTFQMEYEGEGNDIKIIFNTKDGKLTPGTYSPGVGYVAGYTFMNNAYEAFGVPPFEDYDGSLWYTISNGVKIPQLITTGDIVVTKDGPLYSILVDQGKGGVYAQFQGTLGDIDPDGAAKVTVFDKCTGNFNLAQLNWDKSIIINFSAGSVESSTDEMGQTTYLGSGTLLQIQVYSADGNLARGTYQISATAGEGLANAGNSGPMGDGGVFIREVKDGVAGNAQFITEGTVTIDGEGETTKVVVTTKDAEDETVTYIFTGDLKL